MKNKKIIIMPLILVALLFLMIGIFFISALIRESRRYRDLEHADYMSGEWGVIAGETAWYTQDSDSYYITSAEELTGLSNLVAKGNDFSGKTIYLQADIEEMDPFYPIGSEEFPFCGTFDGQGHVINPSPVSTDYYGLFGYIKGAAIKNVGVCGGGSSGKKANGTLVAYGEDSNVSGCFTNYGTPLGSCTTGGLVGYVKNCTFTDCYSHGRMSPTDSGNHTKGDYWGGFAGYAEGCTFTNCYSNMDFSGYSEGLEFGVAFGKAVNCKAENFYYNTENGYMKSCADGSGLPEGFAEVTGYEYDVLKALFAMNENSENSWRYAVVRNNGYMHVIEPRLAQFSYQNDTEPIYDFSDSVISIADGYEIREATEEEIRQYDRRSVIEIETKEQLATVVVSCMEGETFGDTAILIMNDIDLAGYQWLPIGNYYAADNGIYGRTVPFCGTIDGLGHKISNLTIDSGNGSCGFIGETAELVYIQNLTLENCNISAPMYVSGMVASGSGTGLALYNNRVSGRIEGSYASAFATMCNRVYMVKCEAKVSLTDSGESDGLTVRSNVVTAEGNSYTEIAP